MTEALPYYFTGKPCLRGHIAERYTKHCSCVACNNVKRAEYIRNNNEKYKSAVKAGHKRWLMNNPIKARYQVIKSNARRRGIPFDLALNDIAFGDKCEVCSIGFAPLVPGKALPNSVSIDRIDSSKGYERGNIAFICHRCNGMKRDCTITDLERLLGYMRRHLQPANAGS